jgi:hypothetical protein
MLWKGGVRVGIRGWWETSWKRGNVMEEGKRRGKGGETSFVSEYELEWVVAVQAERGEGGETSWKGGKVVVISESECGWWPCDWKGERVGKRRGKGERMWSCRNTSVGVGWGSG